MKSNLLTPVITSFSLLHKLAPNYLCKNSFKIRKKQTNKQTNDNNSFTIIWNALFAKANTIHCLNLLGITDITDSGFKKKLFKGAKL